MSDLPVIKFKTVESNLTTCRYVNIVATLTDGKEKTRFSLIGGNNGRTISADLKSYEKPSRFYPFHAKTLVANLNKIVLNRPKAFDLKELADSGRLNISKLFWVANPNVSPYDDISAFLPYGAIS